MTLRAARTICARGARIRFFEPHIDDKPVRGIARAAVAVCIYQATDYLLSAFAEQSRITYEQDESPR